LILVKKRKHKPEKGETWFAYGQRQQEKFLELFDNNGSIKRSLEVMDYSYSAYRQWIYKDDGFRKKVNNIKAKHQAAETYASDDSPKSGKGEPWTKGFASFRKFFFGMDTPGFQHEIVEAYETTPDGNITLILIPPEHGKTTLFEDYGSYRLSQNPEWRFTVGSEVHAMSRKILSRVRWRMDPEGPSKKFVDWWGPFKPQAGHTKQPWGDDKFDVFGKRVHDEREYSMVALGFNANIAGTRTDHLHGDDLQSLNTIGQTGKFVQKFRQDWLSRPGESAPTTINGTRVEDEDFYECLIEALDDDILRVIIMPAVIRDLHTGKESPLWPGKYTMEMLERIERKVGPDAWSRSYMQAPRAAQNATFTPDEFESCYNPLRALAHKHSPEDGEVIYVGLDPALGKGKNCVLACGVSAEKLRLLEIRESHNLRSNEEIMAEVEVVIRDLVSRGGNVTDLVIETKNFQLGLGRDERLHDLKDFYGFSIREHLTGINKYDENIGLNSMSGIFRRNEIDIPWMDDDRTRSEVAELARQLYAWKPKVSGRDLRQDRVMALWFVWILWTERRRGLRASQKLGKSSHQFKMSGVPSPMKMPSGLLVPSRSVFR
jgi:hypothetical protein